MNLSGTDSSIILNTHLDTSRQNFNTIKAYTTHAIRRVRDSLFLTDKKSGYINAKHQIIVTLCLERGCVIVLTWNLIVLLLNSNHGSFVVSSCEWEEE